LAIKYQRNNKQLLEEYEKKRSLFEIKELPSRQVHLRRFGMMLVSRFKDLYKLPVLSFLEEVSKTMMLNNAELIYWRFFLFRYLKMKK